MKKWSVEIGKETVEKQVVFWEKLAKVLVEAKTKEGAITRAVIETKTSFLNDFIVEYLWG